jgi:hypothetical protein
MVCREEDFPTRKNENGILEYIPYQIILDEKIDASNVIGLPASSGDSDECIFYVNMTTTSGTSATSDRTFNEITEAHNNGLIVKCKFDTYVLPLCFITNSQVIFGGATSNLTVFVTQLSNDTVEYRVAELAFKAEVPTLEEFNSLAVKVDNLPSGGSGGGNVSYFEKNFVLEQGVYDFSIELPVDAKQFFMWTLTYITPDRGMTDERNIFVGAGNSNHNCGKTPNYGSVSFAGVKFGSNVCKASMGVRNDGNYHLSFPGFSTSGGTFWLNNGVKTINVFTNVYTEASMFPAGTDVRFWGVYSQ